MMHVKPSRAHAALVSARAADLIRQGGLVARRDDQFGVLQPHCQILLGQTPLLVLTDEHGRYHVRGVDPETNGIRPFTILSGKELNSFVEKHGLFWTLPGGFSGYRD